MSRDVLIALLVVGLAANVALIALVAYVNHRAATQPRTSVAGDPGAPVAADETDPARLMTLGARLVDPDWMDTPLAGEPHPTTARRGRANVPTAASPVRAGGRRHRFVLPDRHEDDARSERAIAAVLGHSLAPDPPVAPRRRHRARRPAGTPVPQTDLVVSIGGQAPDTVVVHALSAALRGTVRQSDKVVELPDGRIRITLETDPSGGEAFVRRARGVVGPWLSALGPDLDLRVERPRAGSRRNAAGT